MVEVEGAYTIDYQVVLEELLCDLSDPDCDCDDQADAGSSTYETVTSILAEKAQDGGFTTTLAANAAACGEPCDGFESVSEVQAGPFDEPSIEFILVGSSKSAKSGPGGSKSAKSEWEGVVGDWSKSSKSEWEGIVGDWSKSAKSGVEAKSAKCELEGTSKSAKSEWQGIGKSAKSAEMVPAEEPEPLDVFVSFLKDLLALIPQDQDEAINEDGSI